jgi:LuxR family maltose regulon positive regulatory protein
MEPRISPLVLTKLCVPTARRRLISRPRLIELLDTQRDARLILVCAPAGYGKTTLLSEWSQSLIRMGTVVAWYALDPSDDSLIPFRSYLIASVMQALEPVPELTQLSQLMSAAPEMDVQYFLSAIINAVISCERECVLIFDDYHLITAPAIHHVLVYLLEHLPENLRIVIGSRVEPPLSLARLRARGQLFEIRTAGLRFTMDETYKFLNEIMQLGLSPEGVNSLEEQTEGWITGLQLAALTLLGHANKEQAMTSFSGSHRYLVEYLMDEVVQRQPEKVRAFLFSTSILERLCAPLGDAVLDQLSGSEEVIDQLEKSNLFIVALDEHGYWYRYHHLFRDFLFSRLKKSNPDQIPTLHKAACEWLAEHGLLREAAGHAFETGDWKYAASFVERYSFSLIVHSDITTIYEWCSTFPEEVMKTHPMLCLLQALSLAYTFRNQNRARVEARLQQVAPFIATPGEWQATQELSDLSGVVRTFLAFAPDPVSDPRKELLLAHQMLAAYPEGDPAQFSGLLFTGYAQMALQETRPAEQALEKARQIALREHLYFGIVETTFNLARLAQNQGRLGSVIEICHQGQADILSILANPDEDVPAAGVLEVAQGCVLIEQDQLENAERCLKRGLEQMGAGMNPYYLMTAYVALFRLYTFMGRTTEAFTYLDRLDVTQPDLSFCTDGLRVAHLLKTAPNDPMTLVKAENWCVRISELVGDKTLLPGIGPYAAADAYYLARHAWVLAQIAAGRAASARDYLEQQLSVATKQGLAQRVIELSLLHALVSQEAGDHDAALAELEQALKLAQPEGYIRIFEQSPALTSMLVEAARRGISREYIQKILASVNMPESYPSGPSAHTIFGERLSERELEVLRLIAQGATNQEIADRLVITVGTAKSHINHILGKLDSHNRTEAVARARSLGLLDI